MPDRTQIPFPKYSLHKPTGLAVVRLSGRDVYLGPYGSPESEAKYQAPVAEWLRKGRKPPARPKRTKSKARNTRLLPPGPQVLVPVKGNDNNGLWILEILS